MYFDKRFLVLIASEVELYPKRLRLLFYRPMDLFWGCESYQDLHVIP